nr:hypothetical protein [Actinomycetota bacterium]
RAPLPPTRRGADTDETGRGLTVVDAVSLCWGWEPGPLGKVVWCELAVATADRVSTVPGESAVPRESAAPGMSGATTRVGPETGAGNGAAPDGADPGWYRRRL